jgi:hypothetical protein
MVTRPSGGQPPARARPAGLKLTTLVAGVESIRWRQKRESGWRRRPSGELGQGRFRVGGTPGLGTVGRALTAVRPDNVTVMVISSPMWRITPKAGGALAI